MANIRNDVIQALSGIVPANYKLENLNHPALKEREITYVIKGAFDKEAVKKIQEQIVVLDLPRVGLSAEWFKISGIGHFLQVDWMTLKDYQRQKAELEEQIRDLNSKIARLSSAKN